MKFYVIVKSLLLSLLVADYFKFCLSNIGITTVLTLSTIALDSRTDLPKVHYATALDWYIICCFMYCNSTLLEFAGVHYFTKVSEYQVSEYYVLRAKVVTEILKHCTL